MGKVNVYDIDGKSKGEVSVDTIPEGFEPDQVLIGRSLKRQMANARISSAHTKTRSQVRGGGGKLYRQKGTGRARHGTSRAVQFRGGGVVFGPTSERNFKLGMNKKERKTALRHAVWSKIQAGDWLLFDDLGLEEPSTRRGRKFLDALGRDGRTLVLLSNDEEFDVIRKSLRNLPDATILPPERLNTFDLLSNQTILVHQAAFELIRSTWGV